MKKILIAIVLLLSLCLCSCDEYEVLRKTEDGDLWSRSSGITYVSCGLSVKAYSVDTSDVYAKAGKSKYYKIQFEDPTCFITEEDNVMGGVYRNSILSPITLSNFNAVSAHIYVIGTVELIVDQFLAAPEYFGDDYHFTENYVDGTEYTNAVVEAMLTGDSVLVPTYVDEDETRHIRLLSADFPGLSYTVIFMKDINGDCYLYDRETKVCVIAPEIIVERMIG